MWSKYEPYFCVIILWSRWISWVKCETVTLIPPENLLHMLMFDGTGNAKKQPMINVPKHFGVLSGIPIPTLWPVLPESTSTPRTRNTQPKLQPGDSRNKQLFGTTQSPPQNNGIPGSFASGYAASGGGLLSQMVQPSQPIMPSSPFLNSQIPTLYSNPQLQQNNMVQLPQTYPINQGDVSLMMQQQVPIGQSFGNMPSAQTNQLTSQDILLSTGPGYGSQQNGVAASMVNAFGTFMPDAPAPLQQPPLGQQFQNSQFNNPSQVYGYGSQSLFSNQIQSGGEMLGQGLQNNLANNLIPGSNYANSLEDRYPGCHK